MTEAEMDRAARDAHVRAEHDATHGEAEMCGAECIALGLTDFDEPDPEETVVVTDDPRQWNPSYDPALERRTRINAKLDDSLEAIRRRSEESVVWPEGAVPVEVSDALWRAKQDVRLLLAALRDSP